MINLNWSSCRFISRKKKKGCFWENRMSSFSTYKIIFWLKEPKPIEQNERHRPKRKSKENVIWPISIYTYQLVWGVLSNCHGHASLCKKPKFDPPLGSMVPSSIRPYHNKELLPSLFWKVDICTKLINLFSFTVRARLLSIRNWAFGAWRREAREHCLQV